MREGSLEAPTRHAHRLAGSRFLRRGRSSRRRCERVFDICHGCRRCFNLCDSFPRLFDLIDNGPTGELDGVPKEDYAKVVEACTLCDMCFMTKCPYVPPHHFDARFPASDAALPRRRSAQGRASTSSQSQLAETDRNGKLGTPRRRLANWASDERQQADAAR